MVMGGISGLALQCTTGEFRDSTDLGLPGVQEALVKAIVAVGKPVVLVLLNGRPAAIPDLVDPVNAILEAWVPGEEGARAVAASLFGDFNPGGKLPVSVPRSAGQVPVFYNHKPSGMRSNIYGDYVTEPVTPLFPFGHGLSYTSFAYTDLVISKLEAGIGESIDVSLTVTNQGPRAGDEVVQLYVQDEYSSMPRPMKELKGFKRLPLQPGETCRMTFHLPVNQLAYFDEDLDLLVEAGKIILMVGSSSEDIYLTGEFKVRETGKLKLNERVFTCPVSLT
jgi:beta-glucosidase